METLLHEPVARRDVLIAGASASAAVAMASGSLPASAATAPAFTAPTSTAPASQVPTARVTLVVNGTAQTLELDTRTTLLDALREHLRLTGTKKGCDHGQCGACTILVNGRRINACLTLAVMHDGDDIVTIEGLGTPADLHPLQAALVRHDGYQCGYCTPGQICSAKAMLDEAAQGWASFVSDDLAAAPALGREEIAERMSGNLCRCGAYPNIVDAIVEVLEGAR